MPIRMNGGIIKVLVWEKKITQKDLASRAGISERYLSALVTGTRSPSPETLQRIGKELGIVPDLLISGDYASS